MGNSIPTSSRKIVAMRSGGSCERCGCNGSEWHHRRRRAVKNGHFQHCACIGVWLCGSCHRWAHANPRQAQADGFIISSYEDEPWSVPIKLLGSQWATFDCEGQIQHRKESLP